MHAAATEQGDRLSLPCHADMFLASTVKNGAHRVGPSCPRGARRKWSAFLLSLTGQLAALIGQEDTGGHQDRAADNEGLTQ